MFVKKAGRKERKDYRESLGNSCHLSSILRQNNNTVTSQGSEERHCGFKYQSNCLGKLLLLSLFPFLEK